MDAALKQRLIGATVLVALAVIFLPMLLDGPDAEREPGTEQLSLELPNRPDRPLETRELPVLPPSAPSPLASAGATAAEGAEVLPVVDTGSPQRVDALSGEPVGSSAQAASAPSTASTPAPTVSATAPAAAPPSPAPEPRAPAASAPSTAPSPASPATAPSASLPVATAGGSYAVNVGSYANVANAENLLAKLKAGGVAAYAESVSFDGRPVRRIRLGPFAQRGEAERARQAALALDRSLPTSVISLEAASPARAPARQPVASGYAVQIGALSSEADANALRNRARGAGFAAFVERATTDTGPLWRVRVGPELDRPSAERRMAELKSKLAIDGLVVSHP